MNVISNLNTGLAFKEFRFVEQSMIGGHSRSKETVKVLRLKAKILGLKGYSRMKKSELQDQLESLNTKSKNEKGKRPPTASKKKANVAEQTNIASRASSTTKETKEKRSRAQSRKTKIVK